MKMKRTIVLTCALLSVVSANAQTATNDTVTTHELQEVVIEAPKVIRKADKDVYHPSKSAVDNSKNGMQLLNNLMIPSLSVSDALGSITAAGQSVQVRINGRTATIDQVRALLPETIKRVEWMDNPGLRYGGANYVLNFIVANPTLGGSLQVYARPALNTAWGFYMADAKFNFGKSQFEIGTNYKLTNNIKTHRDYTETFTYPNGNTITRKETSRGGTMDNTMGNLWTSYNYIKPDTTMFVAEFSMHKDFPGKVLYNGLLSLSDGTDDILLTDSHGDKGTTPSLSIYLQQHFAHKQMLVVDFSSSFYFGRTFSDYIEQKHTSSIPPYLTDIHTNIKDRNQAYGIEADYIKNWRSSRFTAGVSYTANRNRSEYENLGGEIFHQRQDKVYFLPNISGVSANGLQPQESAHSTQISFSENQTGATIRGAHVLRQQSHIRRIRITIFVLTLPHGNPPLHSLRQMLCLSSLTDSNGGSAIRTLRQPTHICLPSAMDSTCRG